MFGFILAALIASYAVAEIYKAYTTPQQKRKWESSVKIHHGEAGALMVTTGIMAKSSPLVGLGIGLMLHDKDDANKWFKQKRLR